jgi:hypothetical protein
MEMLNFLPKDCPKHSNTSSPLHPGAICLPAEFLNWRKRPGCFGSLSLFDIITIYLGSELDASLIMWGYIKEFLNFLVFEVTVFCWLPRLGGTVHCVQQKSRGLKFCTSRSGSDMTYSCHNLSHITFPIFLHSGSFSVFRSLQLITPCMLTDDTNTFA